MSVFNSSYAQQYDHFYEGKDYKGECDLVEAAFSRFDVVPHTLLDVGCGTGKHLIELARRGYDTAGVDLSASMLDQARRSAAADLPKERQPELLCGDARDFDYQRKFDAAIMMFAVIGYLTANDDVLAGLRNIRRHLDPGALFICDFWYGPSVLSVQPSDRVRVLDKSGEQVIRATSTTLDPLSHTADVTFRLWTVCDQQLVNESTELHRLRYFFPQEFALLLADAGFKLESLTAFPSIDEKPTASTWNAFAVARAV
jgi:SAM-dependent methyltransferase